MTNSVRLFGSLIALAGVMPLGAQSRPAIQRTLASSEIGEGDALRVWVKAEELSGQRVVLAEGATLLAAGELNLRGEAELVVRNLAPGRRRIMTRLPQRMELRSDVVAVQVTGGPSRRRVQERLDIDGVLAAAALDADLDGRMDLLVATREELLLLVDRLDGAYDPAVKLARWPESASAITNLPPGLALNGAGSLGNSQCTVNGVGSSVTANGNTRTPRRTSRSARGSRAIGCSTWRCGT